LEESLEEKIPLWVAEHCTEDELNGSLPRTNPFAPDPKLARGERSELSDYRGSGFDRGHMAPNGNQKVDNQLRIETFYLSNIVPQVGKKFNQSVWADLEDTVRKWSKKRHEVWIITGSLVYDPKEENPATADGLVDVTLIGDNEVTVPTHLFKIVVAKNGNQWESLAFVFENRNYPQNEPFDKHLQSINWIQERSGFDFLPDVKAETGDPGIETRLEASAATRLWD
jgi:endonuclease G